MNKPEFVALLAEKTNTSKGETTEFLDNLAQVIAEKVHKEGDQITIPGLGTFKQKKVAERTGRNPQSGQTIVIPAKTKITFLPVPALKS